jgi:hypothetical protein
MCTGELTVAFAAGVQMVTDGFTVETVHDEDDPPVPVSETVCGLLGSESVRVSVPLRVPVAVGVKVTFTVQLPPAATVAPQSLVCE